MSKPANQQDDFAVELSAEQQDPGVSETTFPEELALGDRTMDATHREFVVLAEQAATAPPEQLAMAMQDLVRHTREHFDQEESRMQSVNHKLLQEHRAEHQRILGDMERFYQRIEKGRGAMARAWVSDNLMEWFSAHARTMDSALAADLGPRTAEDSTRKDND